MTNSISFSIAFDKFKNFKKLNLNPGFHLVYGESGSGKSHFIRSLADMDTDYFSNFKICNQVIPKSLQIIFQNPETQILSNTLESELCFAIECTTDNSLELQKRLNQLKLNLPFVDNWNRHPSSLSGGEMEMLNIVTALSVNPRLLLIDDALSYLHKDSKEFWINWIKKKVTKNCIVIWFTSNKNDLIYGDSAWLLSLSDFKEVDSSHQYNNLYDYNHPIGNLDLKMDSVSFHFEDSKKSLFDELSCDICNARSIGFIGENGKGKTTLAQIISRILKTERGSIELSINKRLPTIAMLNQFPERILGSDTLGNFFDQLMYHKKLNPHLVKKCVNRLQTSQINWDILKDQLSINIPWSTLRMALIIILSHCNYDLLILDEPCFGMGSGQKKQLSKYLKEIMYQKHLILISHDIEFIDSHCDHVYDLDNNALYKNKNVLLNV
tara:strand:- start:726 stop:2042 length:1317 start_codon:yes stop_codon:yes gene_type:complete